MTELRTTRRAMLGAMAAAPVALAVPVAASTSPTADRSAWDALMAKEKALQARGKSLGAQCDAAEALYDRLRPSMDIIDMREFSLMDRNHVARIMDIDAYEKARLDGEGTFWWANDPEKVRQRIRSACDTVRRWRAMDQAADRRAQWSHLNDLYDKNSDAIADTHAELMDLPAPDTEALHWKLLNVAGPQDCLYSNIDQFYTDAERLLGRAAS